MRNGSAVDSLILQGFVSDPNIQSITFVGMVLNIRPTLAPDPNPIFSIVFVRLLLAEAIRPNSTSRDDDVNMGIVLGWIIRISWIATTAHNPFETRLCSTNLWTIFTFSINGSSFGSEPINCLAVRESRLFSALLIASHRVCKSLYSGGAFDG